MSDFIAINNFYANNYMYIDLYTNVRFMLSKFNSI